MNSVERYADTTSPDRPSHADSDSHLVRLWLHGKSDNTREAYLRDVHQFMDFVMKDLGDVKLQDLQEWSNHLFERSLAVSSVARKLAAIKSLFTFGQKIGYFAFNVGAALKMPKVADDLAERILDREAIDRILAAVEKERDKVLIRLFYASGGRVSELRNLCWRSVIPRNNKPGRPCGQIMLHGKGNKSRNILLTPATWQCITDLHKSELDSGYGTPPDPVFRSRKGGFLSRQQLWYIVKKAARAACLPEAVSPHWLRHAHASHALDEGAPVHLVKETLGHKSLVTTSRYTHAKPDDSSANYLDV